MLYILQQSIKVSLIAVLGNKISESDIDGFKKFKFYEHPEIRPQIEVMKTEVMKYQTLSVSIKSFEERKDIKGKDTFDLSDWWKSNCATPPGFVYVLRAVLTNSPKPRNDINLDMLI